MGGGILRKVKHTRCGHLLVWEDAWVTSLSPGGWLLSQRLLSQICTEVTQGQNSSNIVFHFVRMTEVFHDWAVKVTVVATAQGGRAPSWKLGLNSS